ncbi:MAG: GNAT family N-acetyltransferase [Prevotella sp.]|nr:GNAT family N-acetyltransferase [Prevotella sp.]
MIRKAEKKDIPEIINLLYQVDAVHNYIRPDLFKGNTSKYTEQELEEILDDGDKPIFVYDDGKILGHAFCQISEVKNHRLLQDAKTLYIDDICVDEQSRGRHIGKALYEYVYNYAKSIGCHNITLNVWEGNDSAYNFYKRMGMHIQKTGMETIL